MKYALRTTREVDTGLITVYPVFRVRETAHPYRLKYIEVGTAERLQIFDTKNEALDAYRWECIAAEFQKKSQKELLDILKGVIAMLRNWGFSLQGICGLVDAPIESIWKYLNQSYKVNPRVVAKLFLVMEQFSNAIETSRRILPSEHRVKSE